MTDYDKGREAFLMDFDYLYLTGSEDFKEGYREAWFDYHSHTLRNDDSGAYKADLWDAQLQIIAESKRELERQMEIDLAEIEANRSAYTPEPKGWNATNTILGLLIAIIIAHFFLAMWLIDAQEIAR